MGKQGCQQFVCSLLDRLPLGAVILDKELRVHFWNKTLVQWTKRLPGELLGKGLDVFFKIDREMIRIRLGQVLQGGSPVVFSSVLHNHFIPVPLKDGTGAAQEALFREQETMALPFQWPGEDDPLILLLLQDVTEKNRRIKAYKQVSQRLLLELGARTELEEKLVKAKDDALAANRAKDEFLANISHELRTPLNGIMGMLQLMQMEELPGEMSEYVKLALDSSELLLRVINDLIDLASMEAGHVRLEEDVFSLSAMVKGLGKSFQKMAQDKGIKFFLDLDPGLPEMLIGDYRRLRQILYNILGNAVKYTQQGEVGLGIYQLLPSRQSPDLFSVPQGVVRLLFVISDTGPGIHPEEQEAIFDRFTRRVRRESYVQGAGLGLSIVKRLLFLLGGGLALESEPGQGSIFYLSLPFKTSLEGKCEKDDLLHASSLTTKKVLLVEDDLASQKVHKYMLEKLGYVSVIVDNGHLALQLLQHEEFQAVLLDLTLPDIDGFSLCREIRSWPGEKGQVPILAVTARAMEEDRQLCLASGMDGYLTKPVQFLQLSKELTKVFAKTKG